MTEGHEQAAERARALDLLHAGAGRELTDAERAELATLLQRHPGVEFDDFGPELTRLSGLPAFDDAPPPAELRERVTAETDAAVTAEAEPVVRRRLVLALAAAALVTAGAVGGNVVQDLLDDGPPSGPPGTLGAVEQIAFEGEPADVVVDAAVVAHTWGTETMLEVDGLPVGDAYTVVLLAGDGTEFGSGTFIGAELPVNCRLNAAVLRPDVAAIEIRDASGATVMAADLPAASA